MNKHIIPILVILLFIVSAVSPMVIGFKSDAVSEIAGEVKLESKVASGGLMDSPWPMYCHDTRHTGRSPYSTADTWDEIWRYKLSGTSYHCAPVIDSEGVIYVGRGDLYAVYPNGTLKWKYDFPFHVESAPAIDENGIIYIGTVWAMPNYLYAIYMSNGTLKWKYYTGDHVYSSPAIGDDGTIYFGDWSGNIHAVYPNGTRRWIYHTGNVVTSSPAIGDDGTIYVGSHDDYVYALYPNNGTLKWKYKTGAWVHGSPTIGDDGTVYIGSDDGYLYALYPNNGTKKWQCSIGYVWGSPALDENGNIYVGTWKMKFYVVYPNGTIKWKYDAPGRIWFGSSAVISAEGIIYFGTTWMDGGSGAFIALNPDGSERWKVTNSLYETSPAIGQDGTVYACSSSGYIHAFGVGELKADAHGPYYGLINELVQLIGSAQGGYSPYTWHWDFGDTYTSDEQNPTHIYSSPGNYTVTLTVTDDTGNTSDDASWAKIKESNNPPNKPAITGETNGKAGTTYDYDFMGVDPDGDEWAWYYIDWDDGSFEDWIGPYKPGKVVTVGHTWSKGTYIIRVKARDNYGGESEWGTLEVTMPKKKNHQVSNIWSLWWLERFPRLCRLLDALMGNLGFALKLRRSAYF